MKTALKKAFFLILGVMTILLKGEWHIVPFHTLIPRITQETIASGEQIPQQTPFIVGEVEQQIVYGDYMRKANKGQIVTYPGASFIKVHFKTLDLVPGDYVTVSDPNGAEEYTYPGSDSTNDGEPGFWSMSITGDTAVIQLHSQLSSRDLSRSIFSKGGFTIDKYGRGYPQNEIERILPRSACGTNQRRDVVCYQETNPTEFDKSNAVARLLIFHSEGYYSFCTAWRVGVGANLLTNQHCLTSQTDIAGTEAWFNYQNEICATPSVGNITKVTGSKLLVSDIALDFALFTVNSPESVVDFGYLEIDPQTPIMGEQIYIPQHGGGAPKQFGIESELNIGNVCRIDVTMMDGLDNGTDTGYYCDTASGSSGSPVLASSSNKVIAIHHFGSSSTPTCTTLNQGVRMDRIWPLVQPYLLQVSPFGLIDNSEPTFIWNESDSATWYYLWLNGPSGSVFKQWYQASDICQDKVCSITSPVTLSGGVYTWWIQTWNEAGLGPWSDGVIFRVPLPEKATLISPTGSIGTDNPTYTWNEVRGATWYYLWVNGTSSNIFKEWYTAAEANCNGATCSVTPATTLSNGAHTWWVQTWNAAGLGPWSDPLSFNLPTLPLPGKATLLSPNGSSGTNQPTYTWNAVSGATWYYLWVNGPSAPVIQQWYTAAEANCNGTTCSVTPATTLSNGAHTWWIQTWNPAGLGPWSTGMGFSVP